MKLVARALAWLGVLAALVVASPGPPALASTADADFHDCSYDAGVGNGECQHFLRNPAGVTDDPCWCDKCRNGISGQRHDGNTIPPGWNQTTFQTGTMDNYLKRHSVAWGITCSACYESDKGWPEKAAPETDSGSRSARETLSARLAAEQRFFKKPDDVLLAYDKYFYVVTDIQGLKVRMPGGTSRLISKHEWIHLMIERAQFARREWVRNLGEPGGGRPVAMFFTEKERDCGRIEAEYFRSAGAKSLRGNGAEICGKMCLTGIAMSSDRTGGDHELQLQMRHQLAHNYLSLWGSHEIRPKSMPIWMDEGIAHWLSRTLDNFRDDATYCVGEAQGGGGGGARGVASAGAPSWSAKNWNDDLARLATTGKLVVIEQLLGKSEIKHLEEDDVKRSWSYVDFCLSEWREPFVAMLRALRQEKDVREAFQSNLGLRPEDFDLRWKDRVRGKRRTMAPLPTDDEDPAAAGAADRKLIRTETEPKALSARLRGLGEVKDVKTIPVVIDVIAQPSDLVRETALVTLLKTKEPDCIEAIGKYGLAHPDAIVRAYTARICGRLGLKDALTQLQAQLADKNWYARAEAALACGMLGDTKAMAGMRKIADSDPSEKAKIAAVDALAMFHEDARNAVPIVAKLLDSSQWQLRIAAAQALGEMGLMEGVEPLVGRLEKETGRIADEILEALKKISRDDLGRRPENWRNWWEREKTNAPGGLPKRPPPPDETKKPKFDPNDRGSTSAGPPPYFGIEIYSNRVAFVIDATETMLTLFTADPAGAKVLSREYLGRDKLTICKEEVAQALAGLDPRAHFNVIAFGMQIRSYKPNPVPASSGNVQGAVGFMTSLPGQGRTNYYGALKAVLDIGDEPDTNANFRATPDTITLLTDGLPNEGDIIDADTLLEWYTGLNRYARVKTHTITFGLVGVDMPLLRGLAERNGGRFMIVPEAPLKSK